MTLPSNCFRSALALAVGMGTLALSAPVAQASELLQGSELLQASGPSQPSFPTAIALPLPPPPVRIFAITAERRALLNTIRYAEGTWADGDDIGYRIMFGGGLMPSLERHPDRVVRTARYASAAAGAYQFMPFTWTMVSRSLGIAAFGPQVQDQGAIYLIQRRGALALADQGVFSPLLAANWPRVGQLPHPRRPQLLRPAGEALPRPQALLRRQPQPSARSAAPVHSKG